MITRFRVQNYKALKDVTLDLTPIHVLIGPNDSGKTSILEALAALCRSVDVPTLQDAFSGDWDKQDLIWFASRDLDSTVHFTAMIDRTHEYTLSCAFAPTTRRVFNRRESILRGSVVEMRESDRNIGTTWVREAAHQPHGLSADQIKIRRFVHHSLSGLRIHQWNTDHLGLPVARYVGREQFGLEVTGFGLAMVLDDILSDDRKLFSDLESQFISYFPQVRSIKMPERMAYVVSERTTRGVSVTRKELGKGISFEFASGNVIPAGLVSDGMLLVLAYLTILRTPSPPRLLLVEEPENGVHPKRLAEVLNILRGLVHEQSQTQVILTTHSPYALDCFKPEEATVCTKGDDDAVSANPLSSSKAVADLKDVFSLGEIWTSEGDKKLAEQVDTSEIPST